MQLSTRPWKTPARQYFQPLENRSTSYLERQNLRNGTPGRIRTCDLLLLRQPFCTTIKPFSYSELGFLEAALTMVEAAVLEELIFR